VNGKFSRRSAIYDIVLESLETALTLYRPGTSIQEVTGEVVRIMITGLVAWPERRCGHPDCRKCASPVLYARPEPLAGAGCA
jgi:Xaa-Pro aminopeptidase